jgi:hypothetical protein
MGSAMNDIMSAHSFYQNRHARAGSAFGMNEPPVYSPQLGGSPGAPHPQAWDEGAELGGMDQMRYQQFNGAILGEIAQ